MISFYNAPTWLSKNKWIARIDNPSECTVSLPISVDKIFKVKDVYIDVSNISTSDKIYVRIVRKGLEHVYELNECKALFVPIIFLPYTTDSELESLYSKELEITLADKSKQVMKITSIQYDSHKSTILINGINDITIMKCLNGKIDGIPYGIPYIDKALVY